MSHWLGVDTGGTFTDFVLFGDGAIRIHKCLSTPAAPEQAILQGIDELGLTDAAKRGQLIVVHGSTVATNAALEGKGVRTLFITNRGFADMLTLGRQTRPELYNLRPTTLAPPVPAELCIETGGRLGADGAVVEDLTEQDLEAVKTAIAALRPQAVAINLLFSFLDDRFERALADCVPATVFCSRSSYVLPEYKEYERGIATWLNAWLGPRVADYLGRLQTRLQPSPIAVMQSSGGTIDADQAAQRAVNMLLSGPAGGLAAARHLGQAIGSTRLLTFDMGGTSTDVALIDGDIQLTNEGRIANYPVAVPMVDMHTIGAGGGSIASLDEGGMLQVGPQSAGADPGPACYGRGGRNATVTDANAVLGRLRADAFLGGQMTLDIDAARSAVAALAAQLGLDLEAAAEGILALANEHMTRALRVISVQRGHDPADFRLCCFGGAGGLHVCALADNLGMKQAMVPVHGGVLSALGMLVAPKERQLSRTQPQLLAELVAAEVEQVLAGLAQQGVAELRREGVDPDAIEHQPSLDLRYCGQSFSLNIPWSAGDQLEAAFHAAHEERYGHRLDAEVEVVTIRLALKAHTLRIELPSVSRQNAARAYAHANLYGFAEPVPVYHRNELSAGQQFYGPALITEQISTTLVASGWQLQVDRLGNLLLDRHSSEV